MASQEGSSLCSGEAGTDAASSQQENNEIEEEEQEKATCFRNWTMHSIHWIKKFSSSKQQKKRIMDYWLLVHLQLFEKQDAFS